MKEHRNELIKISLSALLLAAGLILDVLSALPLTVIIIIFGIAFTVSGFEILVEAVEGIFEGRVFI